MRYACIASVKGGARCRYFLENPGEMCEPHQKLKAKGEKVKLAPPPDTILVKFNINPSWNQKFQEEGIPRKTPSGVSLEEKHINHAHHLHRVPYRYRDIADSGVPVFGEQGVSDVSIANLLAELQTEGYVPSGVHIGTRRQKKFDVLVIPLSRNPEEDSLLPKGALKLLEDFLRSSCWGFVHVWANPPEKGKIVHTINLGHREPQKAPQWKLFFNHGLWAIKPS